MNDLEAKGLKTEVYLQFTAEGLIISKSGGFRHWAIWKKLSYAKWRKITSSGVSSSIDMEKMFWVYFLEDSSLLYGVPRGDRFNEEGLLSAKALQQVFRAPSKLAKSLISPLYEHATLTKVEQHRVEREGLRVWHGKESIKNPHPLFAAVVSAMNLKEQFSIMTLPSLENMSIRLGLMIDLTLRVYGEAQEMNASAMMSKRRIEAAKQNQRRGMDPRGVLNAGGPSN